jgi:predicted AAA+ superfamily ATPase
VGLNKNGMHPVLLGSASLSLIKSISESLAGRVAFVEMSPFLWQEVATADTGFDMATLWYRGGFPDAALADDDLARLDWFEGYTRTFIERDLAALGIDVAGPQMRKLWTMLAHTSGGLWNASQLASSLGVSYKTVNRYTDILEQTFLVRKLQPFFANIGKRLVKTPKIYMRDTGLLHYFLGIHSQETLATHPNRGASWESFLIEQLIVALSLFGPGCRFWYWRTAGGAEVDLLVEAGGSLVPVEMKLHSSPTRSLTGGMMSCLKDLRLKKGFVIYPGKEMYSLGEGISVLPADDVLCSPAMLLD